MSAAVHLLSLLLISLLWTISQAQSLPTATIVPTYVVLAPGQAVTYTCTVTGNTSPPTWRRNGSPIIEDSNNDMNQAQTQLAVSNFSSNLAGNYTCVASSDVGSVSSSTAVLQLAVHNPNFYSTDPDSPHQVTVRAGQPTAVSCGSFTSIPEENLDWEINIGGSLLPISTSIDRAVGLDQGLYLIEPRVSDNGTVFSCRLTNTRLNVLSAGYVQITIQGDDPPPAPRILVRPQDVTTRLRETVFFECIPGGMGVTDLTVTWTAPNGVRNFRPTIDSFRIDIFSVSASNAGPYTCNIAGIGSFTATLSILAPPSFESLLPAGPVVQVYGATVNLSCAASQVSHWEWFKNGVRLSDVTGSDIVISSTMLEDSGTYQCFAYNLAGFGESETLVNVITIPASISQSPPETQVAFLGQSFSMSCASEGAPPPTYTWLKGDTPLQSGSSFQVGPQGSLVISSVEQSSEGTYRCEATNVLPNGTVVGFDSTTTSITVIAPTTLTTANIGPVFSIQVDTAATLPCHASFDPSSTITYSWTKDGQPLELGERVRLVDPAGSGNLSFASVEYGDAGTYLCEVSTQLQSNGLQAPLVSTGDIDVRVTDTPVAPFILSLTSSFPNTFLIEYVFSGMPSFVSSYSIEVQPPPRTQDTPWQHLQTRSPNAITATNVSSRVLEAFTLYNVRVVAIYVDGTRVPSEVAEVRTGADVPEGPPRDVIWRAPSNTAISLSWKPPSNPRGNIAHYVIQYSQKDDDNVMQVNVPGDQTSYVLEGLREFTSFTIQIAAATSVGPGPFSEAMEAFTSKGSSLIEPQSGPFVRSIGFIVLVAVLGLVAVVSVVVAVLVGRYRWRRRRAKTTGRYHVRHSGYFGSKAIIGMEAQDMGTDADLSESAVASYTARTKRAFNSTSPTGSEPLDMTLGEGESTFGGTDFTLTTGTPQLSTASSARLIGTTGHVPTAYVGHAPSYIDPPSFEETLMKARSRSQSASSGTYVHRDLERPANEWTEGSVATTTDIGGVGQEVGVFQNVNLGGEEDSDNSIEKDPLDCSTSDVTDNQSDHTHYSHLAGTTVPPPFPHHQLDIPRSAGSSSVGVAPASFSASDLVESRLREQTPETPLNYATYV